MQTTNWCTIAPCHKHQRSLGNIRTPRGGNNAETPFNHKYSHNNHNYNNHSNHSQMPFLPHEAESLVSTREPLLNTSKWHRNALEIHKDNNCNNSNNNSRAQVLHA